MPRLRPNNDRMNRWVKNKCLVKCSVKNEKIPVFRMKYDDSPDDLPGVMPYTFHLVFQKKPRIDCNIQNLRDMKIYLESSFRTAAMIS